MGYIQITTAISDTEFFGDTQRGTLSGIVSMVNIGDGKSYPCGFDNGKLQANENIPTGYYYISGVGIKVI
jgi:hypothetical protein